MNDRADDPHRILEPADELIIEGVDVYVAGEDDRISAGRTVTIQESTDDRWVGSIDTDLGGYAPVQLELRLPEGLTPRTCGFVVGLRIRGSTLISGWGPMPTTRP